MYHLLKTSATQYPSVFTFACTLVFLFSAVTAYPYQRAKAIEHASHWSESESSLHETRESSAQSLSSESVEKIFSHGSFASNGEERYLKLADNHQATTLSTNLAEVSIIAEKSQLTEGENVEFKILANSALKKHIIINVHIQQVGDFILWPVPKKVELPAGEDHALISIATDDDRQNEINGLITATLVSGERYSLSSQATAEVEIFDNDDESIADSGENTEISVAGAVIESILAGISKPTITISAVEDSVVRGKEAEFTISVQPVPQQDISIELLIQQFGNSPAEKVRSEILKAKTGSLSVLVKTEGENNSQITVSVMEGGSFSIGTPSSATVSIRD